MSGSKRPEWTVSAVVEATVDETWQALIHSFPGLSKKAGQVSPGRGVQHITATPDGETVEWSFEVDADQHVIGLQGSWWYRGEHAVVPHQRGSAITYSVYNVAPGGTRWLVGVTERGSETRLKGEFQQLISDVGNRLGCRVTYSAG
ncbi:hypothetical protein [Actinoallomurus sp. NPDC052274]|uniref:hypothetical protein n=1 Tax=Actinoallomurus sp. NPDC052274 TaxID=3155420 RepID=UPI003419FC87